MHEVIWIARADADFQNFYERYEDHAEGLGDDFDADMHTALTLIGTFPDMCREVHAAGFRRALLHRWRLGLVYRSEARGIILHAIRDLRSDPRDFARLLDDLARGLA